MILAFALTALTMGCGDLTAPSTSTKDTSKESAQAPSPPEMLTARPVRPTANAPPSGPAAGKIRASHILIAYQGAQRSRATRTKEEAKQLATQILGRAKGGADFASLQSFSDDTGAKSRGGDLGQFDRGAMTKNFSDAAFALQVGQVSDVVETEFGFHIIKRTE